MYVSTHPISENRLHQHTDISLAFGWIGQLLEAQPALPVERLIDPHVVLLPRASHHTSQFRSEELWTSGIVDGEDAIEFSLVDVGESRICMGQNEEVEAGCELIALALRVRKILSRVGASFVERVIASLLEEITRSNVPIHLTIFDGLDEFVERISVGGDVYHSCDTICEETK